MPTKTCKMKFDLGRPNGSERKAPNILSLTHGVSDEIFKAFSFTVHYQKGGGKCGRKE